MESEYQFSLEMEPDFSLLRVQLQQGQKIYSEPSAMATMDPSIRLKSGLKGGIFTSIKRKLGGESLVINTFTADAPGEVSFAPGPMGAVHHYALNGTELLLQSGAFVAHGEQVNLTSKWDGMKGFFSGQGLFLLKASGQGDLFFNSYGAILEVDVRDGYVVDTGCVVAFEPTLQYRVAPLQGLSVGSRVKTFLFGGEGLVCHFSGQGRLWIQTRSIQPFLRWVQPYRKVARQGGD